MKYIMSECQKHEHALVIINYTLTSYMDKLHGRNIYYLINFENREKCTLELHIRNKYICAY